LRLVLADEGVRRSLADATFWKQAAPGESIWLYEGEDEEFSSDVVKEHQRGIVELAPRARAEHAAGYGLVRLQLQLQHAREQPWVKLIRVRRGEYGDEELLVEMTEDSGLWPFLQKGERFRAGLYTVREMSTADKSGQAQSDSGSAGN
jgi:hypothetical protein